MKYFPNSLDRCRRKLASRDGVDYEAAQSVTVAFQLFDSSLGGGTKASAETNTASGGSQIVGRNSILTNPNSFALGKGASYIAPGATSFKGFKGDLTIQSAPAIDIQSLASAISTANANNQAATNNQAPTTITNPAQVISTQPSLASTINSPLTDPNAQYGSDPAAAIINSTPATTQPAASTGSKIGLVIVGLIIVVVGYLFFFRKGK